MERKNILSTQRVVVKDSWKGDFDNSGVGTVKYLGNISAETYCAFIGLDYSTVRKLGNVTYSISYLKDVQKGDNPYCLLCETYIDSVMNDKLSVILDDSEDWLGMFSTQQSEEEEEEKELPSNWKELITYEQREELAKEWCNENSDELTNYLSESDKRDIAYDYAHDNPSDIADEIYNYLDSSDSKDLICKLLDNL